MRARCSMEASWGMTGGTTATTTTTTQLLVCSGPEKAQRGHAAEVEPSGSHDELSLAHPHPTNAHMLADGVMCCPELLANRSML